MKLETAIDAMDSFIRDAGIYCDKDLIYAIGLGIEGLKMIKHYRVLRGIDDLLPLPGETEE